MTASQLPLRTNAPAKINLGLFVGPLRSDGKHELLSVMQSISLCDELTLEPAPDGVVQDEVICPGVDGENLAGRALSEFRRATGYSAPALRLTIDKRIPVAAGLGGGSSDAAAALRLVRHASGLGDEALLASIAEQLGADVPAALSPGRWLARGAGEQLSPLPDPNPPFGVLLLPSQTQLSTADVYSQADRLRSPRSARELHELHREIHGALGFGVAVGSDELLVNDLQQAAISLVPQIGQALQALADSGADITFLSGSGPTAVGLFLRANGQQRVLRAQVALAERTPDPIVATPVGADAGIVRVVGTSQ